MKLCWILAAAFLASHLPAADWPQWRGPNRNGISSEKVSAAWPAGGPKVLWRASVGTGFSSISVSQGRVYTMGNTNNQDTVWCFDAKTGRAGLASHLRRPTRSAVVRGRPGLDTHR